MRYVADVASAVSRLPSAKTCSWRNVTRSSTPLSALLLNSTRPSRSLVAFARSDDCSRNAEVLDASRIVPRVDWRTPSTASDRTNGVSSTLLPEQAPSPTTTAHTEMRPRMLRLADTYMLRPPPSDDCHHENPPTNSNIRTHASNASNLAIPRVAAREP